VLKLQDFFFFRFNFILQNADVKLKRLHIFLHQYFLDQK